ncbi:MAG: winged helix-turn-helix transcriptional regulator [Rubrobacteraceae bacterium]|nr:winged helix-turn-helix transcriptional regulator [Rubrobacteraceae bacterium]MDQ3252126.1 helix-turn-helix domain-containing protein [Actinomycetota bacterium]
MDEVGVARALSSGTRVKILRWLRDPEGNFESMVEGDLTEDGVCVNLIAAKAGVSQPTVSRHLSVLKGAGLLETRRVAQRNYHRRDEAGIAEAKRLLAEGF